MLQKIREKSQTWIAWVIVGFISLPFALWGVNSYISAAANVTVIEIGDEEVHINEFLIQQQNYVETLRERLGAQFDPNRINPAELQQAVINQLVERKLLQIALADERFLISDQQVLNELATNEEFFNEAGRFDPALYEKVLAQQGMPSKYYENQQRQNLLFKQFVDGFNQLSMLGKKQLKIASDLVSQERELKITTFDLDTIKDSLKKSTDEAEQRNYYDENQAQFFEPEKIQVDYLVLDVENFSQDVSISSSEIQTYYEQNIAEFSTQEQRRASHILLELSADAEASEIRAVKDKISQIQQELDQGADFASLAKRYSEDTLSAENDGDLDWFSRGDMAVEFEQAAFNLSLDEISSPVRTKYGYHLIALTGIKAEATEPVENVADEIKERLEIQHAEDLFYEQSNEFANLSFENSASLDVVAAHFGLTQKTSPLFPRFGLPDDPIFKLQTVVNEAFSAPVMEQKLNSNVVNLDEQSMIVMRLNQREAPYQKDFNAVQTKIIDLLHRQSARERMIEVSEDLLLALQDQNQNQADEIIQAYSAQVTEPKWYDRGNDDISEEINKRMFSLPLPKADRPSVAQVIEDGQVFVIEVLDQRIANVDDEEMAEMQRNFMRRLFKNSNGNALFQSYQQWLRNQVKVKMYYDRIDTES